MEYNPEFMAYANEALRRGHTDNILGLHAFRRRKPPKMLETPPAPAHFEIDCTSKEIHGLTGYTDWTPTLLAYAEHGYPTDRLARDLRWHAAR